MTDLVRESDWATTDASEAAKRRVVRIAQRESTLRRIRPPLVPLTTSLLLIAFGVTAPLVPGIAIACLLLGMVSLTFGIVWAAESESGGEEEFEPLLNGREHRVSIGVWQGDALTGEDIGLLWFEEGRLYFVGLRTSFGLVPSQVRGRARIRRGLLGDQIEINLRRETIAGPMRLSFRLRPDTLNADFAQRTALQTYLNLWVEDEARGEGQFPPVTLGPGIKSEGRLLTEAALATFPPALIFCAVASSFAPERWGTWLFVGLLTFAGMVPAGNLRWRALRDRRRLRSRR